ncbi:putative F-box/kelch-repeat protein At5g24040 isoform X2 [Elaeis guineensis]|uniref:F-box/kelch-repeat protein At5g24040 n=1 Tax=Elaeis guineensis var. tenera TaxID=51953 RepID=A0A6I9S6N7_ELAGV|nr:putative F-box/kelch-repeat protein At5g24040 [Elaeis guineensis]
MAPGSGWKVLVHWALCFCWRFSILLGVLVPYLADLMERFFMRVALLLGIQHLAGFSMGSWSDAPIDIVQVIVEKINEHSDSLHFGAVCKPWRSVYMENRHRLPYKLPMPSSPTCGSIAFVLV